MSNRQVSCRLLVLLALLLSIILAAVPVLWRAWVLAEEMGSAKRLTQIGAAMGTYRQVNGCFPPQYLTDKFGRPAHSWRVLLLPYLERDDLYRRYKFDEPWDGPHNRLLAEEIPGEYRGPFLCSQSTLTQYVGIVGKDTAWQGDVPLRIENLHRPSARVVLVVEAANSDINWMEPRDIPLEQALLGIHMAGGRGIQSNYSDGLPAEMVSGDQTRIPLDIPPDAFRKMLTITSGTP